MQYDSSEDEPLQDLKHLCWWSTDSNKYISTKLQLFEPYAEASNVILSPYWPKTHMAQRPWDSYS